MQKKKSHLKLHLFCGPKFSLSFVEQKLAIIIILKVQLILSKASLH